MDPSPTDRCACVALVAGLVLASATAFAEPVLAPFSPFLPHGAAGSAGASEATTPVELRGVMTNGDQMVYCLYDPVKKRSVWLGLNETGYPFVVRNADPSGENVTVDFQGRSLRLALRKARVSASAAPQGPGGTAGSPASGAVAGAPPAPDTPDSPEVAEKARRAYAAAHERIMAIMKAREQAKKSGSSGTDAPSAPPER